MADDIGEALDFVVGFAQIGGAFVDRGLQIEVVVAQSRFGGVARVGRAPHQKDRDRGQRDHEAGADHGHDRGEPLGAVRRRGAPQEQLVLFCPHRVGDAVHSLNGFAGAGLAQHRDAAGEVVALDEVNGLGKFLQPRFDRRTQLFDVSDLNRIVRAQGGEFVDVGQDSRRRGFMFGKKPRIGSQKVAARGAFGAADLQQQS